MENVGEYMTALIPSVVYEATIREVADFVKSK
jgi:hypothetical protein